MRLPRSLVTRSAETSTAAVDRLQQLLAHGLADKGLTQRSAALGIALGASTARAFAVRIANEATAYAPVGPGLPIQLDRAQ